MQNATQIQTGATVVGSDNQKVGDVAEVGPNYIYVRKGLIFTKDLFIPFGEIQSIDGDGSVMLNVTKDAVDTMGWDTVPEGSSTTDWNRESATTSADWNGDPAASSTGTLSEDGTRLTRSEEQLRADTRREQAGEVRVGKDVVEERQTFDVPVEREEVEIRRHPVDRPATADDMAYQQGESVRVPVTAEHVEVTKEPRVVEELEIDKRRVTDTERVDDTVRKERFDVDRQGDVRGTAEPLDTNDDA